MRQRHSCFFHDTITVFFPHTFRPLAPGLGSIDSSLSILSIAGYRRKVSQASPPFKIGLLHLVHRLCATNWSTLLNPRLQSSSSLHRPYPTHGIFNIAFIVSTSPSSSMTIDTPPTLFLQSICQPAASSRLWSARPKSYDPRQS